MDIVSLLRLIAWASWLLVLLVIVLIIVRVSRRQSILVFSIGLVVVILAALVMNVISAGLVNIKVHQRGVLISAWPGSLGVQEQPMEPGLHWIKPGYETVVIYSIARQTYSMTSADQGGDDSVKARTSDDQMVKVDASVIFHVDPEKVNQVHEEWWDRYVDGLIRPTARGVIRETVSQFTLEEVIRADQLEMTDMIFTELGEILEEHGLILDDLILHDISLSEEGANSVEQKQIVEMTLRWMVFGQTCERMGIWSPSKPPAG